MASSDISSVVNYFATPNEGFTTTLGSTILAAATTVPLNSVTGLTNASIFVGIIEPGLTNQQVFTGVVDTGGSQITGVKWTRGSNVTHAGGVTIVDYVTGTAFKMLSAGVRLHANQDGSLIGAAVRTALGQVADTGAGWTTLGVAPSTITANGNRSYQIVFNGSNQTGSLSNGMRLLMQRTTAAPTKCTSLNGTTQYYSKTSPNKMTFTDDFVVSAWIKLSSYAAGSVASRYNGTSGWDFQVGSTGQVLLIGFNAGAANFRYILSSQALPLNRWVHVAAQLDMSAYPTVSTTTNYVMIDGVDVTAAMTAGGTSPSALIQAGNLEIGSRNAGTQFFPGKIAQVAIYNAKVTQATIKASMNQTLSGAETSLSSAYSFNNSTTDLNTSTPNDLSAQASAVATTADSPFAQAATAGSLEYGIITACAFSTDTTLTVQVPEGSTIPTTGGVSTVSYSAQQIPYGFPGESKFKLSAFDTSGTLTNPQIALMVLYVTNNPVDGLRYANTGTAAGTFYLHANGAERVIKGATAAVASGSSYTVQWIPGWFTTVVYGSSSVAFAAGTDQAYANGSSSADTTNWTVNIKAVTGSGSMPIYVRMEGT